MGLPRADRTRLIDPAAWIAGQGAEPARAAMAVGRRDKVVAVARLVALEVEAMLWAAGTPLTPVGFALHLTTAIARPAAHDEGSARRAIAQPTPKGVN